MWHPDPEINRQRAENVERWRREKAGLPPNAPGAWLAAIAVPFVVLWICCGSPLQSLFGDHEEPEEVVRAYVRATLIEPDDAEASRLTCSGPLGHALLDWRPQLDAIRAQHGRSALQVEITSYRETVTGIEASADVTIAATMKTNGQPAARTTRSFHFELSDLSSWKVCTVV